MNLINKLNGKNKEIVDIIKNAAKQTGYKAYIVGGVVRDLILNKDIKDIDFLIEGNAIEFVQNAGFKIKSIHDDFKTIKAEILGCETDFASTRSETYPSMGCLPILENWGIKIEQDLKRRDFTINSIAIDIKSGEIIDPYFGQKDIQEGILKILHEKSFKDDPTRILRGLDFKYRFNFDFCKNTKKLIQNTVETFDNKALSIDRIYLTLNKIFKNENADKILEEILDYKIYKIWTKSVGIEKNQIKKLKNTIELFQVEEKNKLYIMALENSPYIKAPLKNDFEIYEFFKKFNLIQLAFYYFKTEDASALKYLKIKDIKPIITGKTLIEKGFPQGEIIGVILNTILKEKILNPENFDTEKKELDFVFKNF